MSHRSDSPGHWSDDAPDTVRSMPSTVRARASRSGDEKGRHRGRQHGATSAPQSLMAHHGRAPDAAWSTLRQNKAFVERLRRAAVRSDRPPPMPHARLTEDTPVESAAPFALVHPRAPSAVEATAQLPPARRAAERRALAAHGRRRWTIGLVAAAVVAASAAIAYFNGAAPSLSATPIGVLAR